METGFQKLEMGFQKLETFVKCLPFPIGNVQILKKEFVVGPGLDAILDVTIQNSFLIFFLIT